VVDAAVFEVGDDERGAVGLDELTGAVRERDGVELLVDGVLRRVPYTLVEHAVVEVEFKDPPQDELALLEEEKSR
jgi:ribosome maturation factor RimP